VSARTGDAGRSKTHAITHHLRALSAAIRWTIRPLNFTPLARLAGKDRPMIRRTATAGLVLAALSMTALTGTAQNRAVSIVEPKDDATVSSPFKVRFDVRGMKVAPAGDETPNSGHHHLLINGDPIPKGEEIPFTRRNLHLSKAQTEIEVALQPGTYKLTAQFGDSSHKSLGPDFAHTITVKVR
jgi:hypothetical protein